MTSNLISDALKRENHLPGANNSILQIGPGNKTVEISLESVGDSSWNNLLFKRVVGVTKECSDCLLRLKCRAGKRIEDNCIGYNINQFDEVVVLANSSLRLQSSINVACNILKSQGRLMFFVQNLKEKDPFCFSVEEILPQINLKNMEMESITHMLTDNCHDVMCLVVSKK